MPPAAEFDAFAQNYEAALNQGLALTGEGRDFFAAGRVQWLRRVFTELGEDIAGQPALDFGCGTGAATPYLRETLHVGPLTGTDPSEASLEEARASFGAQATFATALPPATDATFRLAYCNGVFHHIPVADRPAAVGTVWRALAPGGLFALWENNPWNPVVRYMMAKVPFDADAILLWPRETRRRLRAAGFEILRTDFCFVFPKALAALRPCEPALRRWPLGGQYLVLARKPK